MNTRNYDVFDSITQESIIKKSFNFGSFPFAEYSRNNIDYVQSKEDLINLWKTRLELEKVIKNSNDLPFQEKDERLVLKTGYNKKLVHLLISVFDLCRIYIQKKYMLDPFCMMFYQEAKAFNLESWKSVFHLLYFKKITITDITNDDKISANNFVTRVREIIQDKNYKKKVENLKKNNKRNFISGLELINTLFDKCSRLMVIRIDLAYSSTKENTNDSTEENKNDFIDCNDINLERVWKDRKNFFNKIRKLSISKSMLGYIWKLEYGEDKGLHYHMIFFFDGSKVCKDAYYADEIGKYWNKITEGSGCYYNCNRAKSQYKNLGIGIINHYDTNLRDNLIWKVLAYLVKKDQVIQPDVKAYRSFGRSEMPEPKSPVGKLRKNANQTNLIYPIDKDLLEAQLEPQSSIVNSDSKPTCVVKIHLGVFTDQRITALWQPSKEFNNVLMILGAPDSGKTDILKSIAYQLLKKEFPVLVIDFNGYIDLPCLDTTLISLDTASKAGVNRLVTPFDDSKGIEKILSSNNRINLSKLDDDDKFVVAENLLKMICDALYQKGPIPVCPVNDSERYRLFVVIDEAKILTMYKRNHNRRNMIFNILVKEGQKLGIGLIFASQISGSFSDEIKANISAKLVLKSTNLEEAEKNAEMVYVNPKEIDHLEGKGDGYYRCNANQNSNY